MTTNLATAPQARLTAEQKVNELERLLYCLEAVVREIEPNCDGTRGSPNANAHGLQMAAAELVEQGLRVTGAHRQT